MVIRKLDAKREDFETARIWDYPLPSENIGISLQTLTSRGPIKGQYLNTVCHEIYFILSGIATFFVNGVEEKVGEHDVVIVEPNTSHYIETNNLKYITITRPNWYEQQYKVVQ